MRPPPQMGIRDLRALCTSSCRHPVLVKPSDIFDIAIGYWCLIRCSPKRFRSARRSLPDQYGCVNPDDQAGETNQPNLSRYATIPPNLKRIATLLLMLVYPISSEGQLQFVGTRARPLCASARAVCRLPFAALPSACRKWTTYRMQGNRWSCTEPSTHAHCKC